MTTPSTSNALIESDLRGVLEAAGGNYVAAYDQIVGEQDAAARTTRIANRSQRVERFKDAVANLDRGALAKANKAFKGYLALVRQNQPLAAGEPRQLTTVEAKGLMSEAISIKEMQEALTARWETIKEHVFGHMTEQFAADPDESFPEHVAGSLDVPELGYRFAREGCGRKEPELNEKALKALVGQQVWDQITDVEVVRVEHVSIPKLMALAVSQPALLEDLRRSLKVGEWKNARLNVRPL